MTEVLATIKYLRVSPKKLREVVGVVRGLSPIAALDQLKFLPKRAAQPLAEALKSAIANATNNLKLKIENLRIKTIEIGEGPRLKRWRAVSRGAAHQYKRRTSHIKVILEEMEKGKGVIRGSKNKS